MDATSEDRGCGADMVTRANAIALGTSESFTETSEARWADVKMTQNGRTADVEPVGIIRRLFVCGGQLDNVDPIRHPYLASPID